MCCIHLKDHSSFCRSSWHWAMSRAIKNSLKSRKSFPSESKILNIWLQKLSAFPDGNTFVKRSSRWERESFPFGHSDRKDRNQNKIVFSSNLVLFKQKSRSLLLRECPVGKHFLNAGSSSDSSVPTVSGIFSLELTPKRNIRIKS